MTPRSLTSGLFLLAAMMLAAPARANDKLTVLLDWFANPNHAPLVVAGAIGAYQREGLDVTFIQPADPTMPVRLVAAGHGDIAMGYQAMLYLQVERGLPVSRVGVLMDHTLETLVALDTSGIKSIADLKGRRIGYNEVGGDTVIAEIGQVLSTAHLTLNDVTLVDVGPGLTTSLLTHRIDAVGVNRNFEPFEVADKGQKVVGFDFEKYGVPSFDELIMVTRSDRAHDPKILRFLRAVREGEAYLTAHPDESWKLFTKAYPSTNDSLNHAAWNFSIPYFAKDPLALDRDKYEKFGAFLVAHHVIKQNPPLASYTVSLEPDQGVTPQKSAAIVP